MNEWQYEIQGIQIIHKGAKEPGIANDSLPHIL